MFNKRRQESLHLQEKRLQIHGKDKSAHLRLYADDRNTKRLSGKRLYEVRTGTRQEKPASKKLVDQAADNKKVGARKEH